MDMQEAFDRAARGVIEQGGPSLDRQDTCCCYLSDDGKRRCGVGHIMPNDMVRHKWDRDFGAIQDLTWEDVPAWEKEKANLLELPREFLIDLQAAHDEPSNQRAPDYLAAFRDEMRKVALTWKLSAEALS